MSTTAEAKLECCAISGGSRWASSSSAWPWPSPSRWPSHRAIARRQRSSPCLGRRRRSPRHSSRLAGTTQVLTRATAASGIPAEDLRTSVHASVQQGALVAVSATASTGAAAARRANAVAGALAIVGRDIAKTANGRLAIVVPARPPGSRISPRPWLNAAIGLLVGLLAAAIVLLIRDRHDRRPREPAELEDLWGLPVVAAMRNVGMNGRVPPDIIEGYRALRANLFLRSGGDLPHAVIVTSAVEERRQERGRRQSRSSPCREWIPRDRGVGGPARLGAAPAPGGRGRHRYRRAVRRRHAPAGCRDARPARASRMPTEPARSTSSPTARRRSSARRAS